MLIAIETLSGHRKTGVEVKRYRKIKKYSVAIHQLSDTHGSTKTLKLKLALYPLTVFYLIKHYSTIKTAAGSFLD